MGTVDYDRALYYIYRNEWDNLLLLMVRTKDDLLSKKIEHFLHACHFEYDLSVINRKTETLFKYLDHALEATPIVATEVY
ncbi:YhdB family protein [Bacillus solimangrovi]|uniref:YhdB-like protein n=1 Tax=Bacillus solimangrovi TaxID=1305675 RepID=A0A1E5LFV2_9BACI|nr:YhdB family protein [Bacillus solimangrovi]OEH92959.1 hypothetical protein BFG57_14410 [Bacillus solimangrovi]